MAVVLLIAGLPPYMRLHPPLSPAENRPVITPFPKDISDATFPPAPRSFQQISNTLMAQIWDTPTVISFVILPRAFMDRRYMARLVSHPCLFLEARERGDPSLTRLAAALPIGYALLEECIESITMVQVSGEDELITVPEFRRRRAEEGDLVDAVNADYVDRLRAQARDVTPPASPISVSDLESFEDRQRKNRRRRCWDRIKCVFRRRI